MTVRTSPPAAGRPLYFEDLSVGMRFVSPAHQPSGGKTAKAIAARMG